MGGGGQGEIIYSSLSRKKCDRSYEVKGTVNFVFVNDYCADDH